MDTSQNPSLLQFVILEGVDGSGKTTLAKALANYYRSLLPDNTSLYADSFPGSLPDTLGQWVYRFHHRQTSDTPPLDKIAPPALQLLHIAAHVDTILTHIAPTLNSGGHVILDRYWWSTYAYTRIHLPPQQVWPMLEAERIFWQDLPRPVAIYLTRQTSLKSGEIDPDTHARIDAYYQEVIAAQQQAGIIVHQLNNDGPLDDTWQTLLNALNLPPGDLNA